MLLNQKFVYKIELVTTNDVLEFCKAASKCNGSVFIVGKDMKVNARSFLGACLAKAAWNELYVEADCDCYNELQKFLAE